jgi:hypothetical protein
MVTKHPRKANNISIVHQYSLKNSIAISLGRKDNQIMENGEWRMENGEWRVENGECRMENGE